MALASAPTSADVDRYISLRSLSMQLVSRITETIPKKAFDDIGKALGIMRDGVLEFETEDMTGVLMDCCLYDWFKDGRNVMEQYWEAHPPRPGTDEAFLMEAYLGARYRILLTQSARPGAGVHCLDVITQEQLFLMDVALSRNPGFAGGVIATRTVPLGAYWMTGGAPLPMDREALDALMRRLKGETSVPNHRLALLTVRACLDSGAAEHVAYAEVGRRPQPRVKPLTPGRNERCPCGSGRKYKVCCGR